MIEVNFLFLKWPRHGSGAQSPASHRRVPGLIPGQSMLHLWYTKWHWDTFISQYFGYPLSVLCNQCSILIFIYMLPSPEGQAGVAWKPSNKALLFRKSESIG